MDINKLMEQAKEMQSKMQQMQSDLGAEQYTGKAGAGALSVTAVVTGTKEVVSIDFPESLMEKLRDAQGSFKKVFEELTSSAVNDALRKAEDGSKGHLSSFAKDFNLPKDFKMPGTE